MAIQGLNQPLRLGDRYLVNDRVDLEADRLYLIVPRLQDISRLKVHRRIYLIDVAKHTAFADHLAGNTLGLFSCKINALC